MLHYDIKIIFFSIPIIGKTLNYSNHNIIHLLIVPKMFSMNKWQINDWLVRKLTNKMFECFIGFEYASHLFSWQSVNNLQYTL